MSTEGPDLFERIVCGVDGTPESLEAVRQAARLRLSGSHVHLFSAVYLAGAVAPQWPQARIEWELQHDAGDAIEQARAIAGAATTRIVNGPPVQSLLEELRREQASLLCVGSHSRHRLAHVVADHVATALAPGIVAGHVATTMLHEAPCPVLIARPPREGRVFPAVIVVGIDGSPSSAIAYQIGRELAERFGSSVVPVTGCGGMKYVDSDGLLGEYPELRLDERRPLEAVLAASANADLVILGSRGARGIRALGSISESVGHLARCSVLVVRGIEIPTTCPVRHEVVGAGAAY